MQHHITKGPCVIQLTIDLFNNLSPVDILQTVALRLHCMPHLKYRDCGTISVSAVTLQSYNPLTVPLPLSWRFQDFLSVSLCVSSPVWDA